MLKKKKALLFEIKLEKRLKLKGKGKKEKKRLINSGLQKIEWLSKHAILKVKK